MYIVTAALLATILLFLLAYGRNYLLNKKQYKKKTANAIFATLAFLVVGAAVLVSILLNGVTGLALFALFFGIPTLVYLAFNTKKGIFARLGAIKIPRLSGRASFWCGLVAVLLPTVVFAAFLSTRTMPMAEGWYSVYAKLMNEGAVPYRDFELLFMPLYAYIISGLTALFGYKLIVLRIFGVVLFAALAALTYRVFTKLFKPWIAVVATVTAALYLQSEVVQIFYDYIRVFDVFTYIATLLLILHIARVWNDEQKHSIFGWRLVLSGIFASLAFLVRQNSGAFVMAYTVLLVIFMIVYTKQKKLHAIHLAQYVVSFIVPIAVMLIYMYSNGTLSAFLGATVGDALESKGGMMTVLFAWIPRSLKTLAQNSPIFLALAGMLGLNFVLYKRKRTDEDTHKSNALITAIYFLTLVAGALITYFVPTAGKQVSNFRSGNMPYVVFYVMVAVFIVAMVWLFKNKASEHKRWVLLLMTLSGMTIAIGYGSGTSAGLSEGQTALALGLIIALLLHFSAHAYMHLTRILAFAMSACLCLSIVSFKYDIPYSWWGLTEGNLRYATKTIDNEYLSGIKVSRTTKYGYERILNIIDQNTKEGDSIFVFPHVPIFYLLSDRYSDTYTMVQWFDVASDDAVIADIETLKQSNPKVIVYVKISDYVSSSHETLFRGDKQSGLVQMANAIETLVQTNPDYRLGAKMIIQGYDVEVYYLAD